MRAGSVPFMVGALGSAAVVGAYRPIIQRWPWSPIGALTSVFASELPEVAAGAHVLAAAGALRTSGWRRAAGLALNGAALAGLAGLVGDARRSAEQLSAALAGAGVAGVDFTRRPPGVLPGPVARRRYRRVADVSYSEHGPFGTLDVWHRTDLPLDGKAPVLIQVHGGGWTMGDKRGQAEPMLGYLAERGFVCVTVNYRLAPADRWPAMIVDVKRAIAWVREHISGHGGDPDWLAITGGSAGGHLCALAALSANDPDYQPGFPEVDTSLRAVVPFYGVFDFTRNTQGLWPLLERKVIGTSFASDGHTYTRASPVKRIGPETPPFLVIHGSTDTIVGVNQSRRLVEALRSGSPSPVGYAELPRAQHGFDALSSARTAYTADAVYRFLSDVHRRTTGAEQPPGAAETGRKAPEVAR